MLDENSPRYEGWRVAVAAAIGVFVSFASLLVDTFGIFLKPLAEEFSWSREAVSAAFRIAAITVAVCSPPLGYLLDRIHPRRIILPCLTIFGCAFASWSLLTPHL
jgi:MFS family permease